MKFSQAHEMFFVDIGNSRLKWLSREALSAGRRAQSIVYLPETLRQLLDRHWGSLEAPSQVAIASVADVEINHKVSNWVEENWGLQARFFHSRAEQGGVKTGYQSPDELGVDRWMTLIGCRHLFTGPACIVDLGTAVTVDLLDASGQHYGGVISPGLRMMREALVGGTAMTTSGTGGKNAVEEFARATEAGIHAGAAWSIAGLIEYACQNATKVLGEEAQLFLCGGDAPRIQPLLHRRYRCEPDLVLIGLAVLADTAVNIGSV